MRVIETFLSIQGEGPRIGRPCFFVRTAGCNLACPWCDTGYASDGPGNNMAPTGILSLCSAAFSSVVPDAGCAPLVCVTGGEPMMQPDVIDLLSLLADAGFDVDLMTNGTYAVSAVPPGVSIVMDLKVDLLAGGWIPPFIADGGSRPGQRDAVKFVVRGRADFEFAAAWAAENGIFGRVGSVWAAPAWGILDPADLATFILGIEPRFRLGIQLHKYIWGAGTRM